MATICCKDLSITIATGKAPFAYYKLDTKIAVGGFDGAPDSMPGALDMNNSNATATIVPGKIGQAWSWSGSAGRVAGGSAFDFTGLPFLVRFWARCIGTPASWGVNQWNPVSDNSTSYRFQVFPVATGGTFQVRLYAIGVDTVLSTPALDATWRRVIGWYDLAGGSINIQIDDNAPDTTAIAGTGAGATRFDMAGLAGGLCEIDELGFWKGADAIWSAADFNSDWNGGAGKTYP